MNPEKGQQAIESAKASEKNLQSDINSLKGLENSDLGSKEKLQQYLKVSDKMITEAEKTLADIKTNIEQFGESPELKEVQERLKKNIEFATVEATKINKAVNGFGSGMVLGKDADELRAESQKRVASLGDIKSKYF